MECLPLPEHVISDERLAAVLTYVRASWDNKESEVTPQMVRTVRSEWHR
jgi:mono/diheme cytochrome c family protein